MAPCDNETDQSALDRIYHLSFSDEKKTSTFWNAVISYEPTPPIEPSPIEHQHPPPTHTCTGLYFSVFLPSLSPLLSPRRFHEKERKLKKMIPLQ